MSSFSWTLEPDYVAPSPPAVAASATETDPRVLAADVWARDLIEVTFSHDMLCDEALASAANYSIIPKGSEVGVDILSVNVGKNGSTRRVFLVVSPFTVGGHYTLKVSTTNIKTTSGATIVTTANAIRFVTRRTKIDDVVESRPGMYDTSVDSVYRKLINAFARQDDLIGGNRAEYVEQPFGLAF